MVSASGEDSFVFVFAEGVSEADTGLAETNVMVSINVQINSFTTGKWESAI